MGRRSAGFLHKSRDFLSKSPRERGRPSPAKFLKEFEVGDKVVIDVEPSIRRGMPHRRYQGKVGVVTGKRGEAYLVDVKIGGKTKHLIVLPVHLKKHAG
ncbi:MAG: 50S ribosomal protein L21e [Candidatus Korarchaeum sp.]|jgi:large subunit ribosomal protein L21e|nr:50S ribosomal protein L21e [Candidatus Korarchaeum sp.]